jgi:peptidoglycan/LPS O-acetylase OafA/YrhL
VTGASQPAPPTRRVTAAGDVTGPLTVGRHRADIQGLRAVAVLLVAFGHAGVGFLKGGYVGVDVFFVLSGFLITGILLSGASKRGYASLLTFYARRARRILPAATLTLVATDVAAYGLLNFVRARQVMWDSVWASFFAANVHFARQGTDYFARELPPSPIQHFWTLAVEEQFYLVWPVVLVVVLFGASFVRRARRAEPTVTDRGIRRLLVVTVLAAAASLAWSIHDTRVSPTTSYFSAFSRAWELALGALLALGASHVLRVPAAVRSCAGWVGVGAIVAAGVTFSDTTPFPGYAALLPTVGTALVIGAGIADSRLPLGAGRLLGVAPLRYVGDRSYAFYLWHWPVLILAEERAGHALSLPANLLLLAVAFGLSIASYRLFENPIRKARWSPRPSLLLWPASIGAVVIAAGGFVHAIDRTAAQLARAPAVPTTVAAGTGPVLPAVKAAVEAVRRGSAIPSPLSPPVGRLLDDHYVIPGGCAPHEGSISSQICRFGDTTATRAIVVMGDSHAQMWMPAILSLAKRDGWVVIPFVKSTCLPNRWVATDAEPKAECRAWYRWAVRQARRLHPYVTLITGSWNTPAIAAEQGLYDAEVGGIRYLTTAMAPYSKHVVVIGDPPAEARDPVDCLLSANATMSSCSTSMTPQQNALYDAIRRVARARGAFIDTLGWFCFSNDCPTVVGHTITRGDVAHLTTTYASELVPPFRSAFLRAIRHSPER